MGNHCQKVKHKKNEKNNIKNETNPLAHPPSLKNAAQTNNLISETNREQINIGSEKDPQLIFAKLSSMELTESLKNGHLNLENYVSKLKELDIDILVTILKKMNALNLQNQINDRIFSKIKPEFSKITVFFGEYQSKYLSLNPKESKDFALKFLKIYIETFHLMRLYEDCKEDKKFHEKWNELKKQKELSDCEYLLLIFSELEKEASKYFKIGHIPVPERNLEQFNQITKNFINEVFDFAISKFNEENFVESWNHNHNEKFGKESDHKARKCFDYQFEIHMLSH